MDEATAIQTCHKIIKEADAAGDSRASNVLSTSTLLDYLDLTVTIIKDWPKSKREKEKWLKNFLTIIQELRGDGERIVAADPIILYKPQHGVAEQFHQSSAMYRYFYGGNRISKSNSAYVDNAWIATGRHPFRRKGLGQGSVVIIGSDYQSYAPKVFTAKMVKGELDNPISPLFPVGGRWLHHYDIKHHTLYIACAQCAANYQAENCKHALYTISLLSDKGDPKAVGGFQVAQFHLDEIVKREFFTEAQQRIKTVRESGGIVTETPINGEAWWTYEVLYKLEEKGKPDNWLDESKRQVVSCHTIDQFSAGLTPPEQIVASMRTMPEYEIQARIFGRHVNANEMSVFDLQALGMMAKELKPCIRGDLLLKGEEQGIPMHEAAAHSYDEGVEVSFSEFDSGNLKVWEPPKATDQYVIGADVAQGLSKGDASAAHVFKLKPVGSLMEFEQVAVYHGWIDTKNYADALFRIGLWYGCATLVIENNGPGLAVIQRLFDTLGCWFLFRDLAQPAGTTMDLAATYGINTNLRSKSMIISVLQSVILSRRQGLPGLVIRDKATLNELRSYIQELSREKRSFVLKGAGSSRDDLVMAAAMAVYAATAHSVYNWQQAAEAATIKKKINISASEEEMWRAVKIKEEVTYNEGNWY